MIVAPPSVRPGVGVYRWINEAAPIAEAPAWLIELVKEQPREQGSAEPEADIERIATALAAIPNNDVDYDAWNCICMATWRATGGNEEGLRPSSNGRRNRTNISPRTARALGALFRQPAD